MDDREFTQEDLQQNRMLAAAGYVVFFVPLIWCRKSKLGRFCANQGLILMIVQIVVSMLFRVLGRIPLLGWLFGVIGGLAGLALFVVGLLCAAQLLTTGRASELPFIGFLRLIPLENDQPER